LYFIPIVPIGSPQVYVECSDCRGTFKEEVLDLKPPTEADQRAMEVQEHIYHGMSLETAERQLVKTGMDPDDARDLAWHLAGKRVWSCVSCGDHYSRAVQYCPTCRAREDHPGHFY
jgi:hypothetical protein